MWRSAAWLWLALLGAQPALAASDTSDKLRAAEAELQQAQDKEKTIAEQTAEVERDMASLQRALVSLTADVQKAERALSAAEEKLRLLRVQEQEKSAALEKSKAQLEVMISAAIRLSQTPPEAAVMMPGDFEQAAKAARVLSSLSESIRQETESIHMQMEELRDIAVKVEKSREAANAQKKSLLAKQAALEGKLKQRRVLSRRLAQELGVTQKRVSELSRQAKDLRGLLAGLEQARREQEDRLRQKSKRTPFTMGPIVPRGRFQMPAAGQVERRFGESLGRNGTSKGVVLRTRGGAKVVAPAGGEVVFAGSFLDYGRMVILRHNNGIHTMLSGLGGIDVTVGQFLLEGEPIGAMGNDTAGTDLYVELRERSQPVDPVYWISDLRKN